MLRKIKVTTGLHRRDLIFGEELLDDLSNLGLFSGFPIQSSPRSKYVL